MDGSDKKATKCKFPLHHHLNKQWNPNKLKTWLKKLTYLNQLRLSLPFNKIHTTKITTQMNKFKEFKLMPYLPTLLNLWKVLVSKMPTKILRPCLKYKSKIELNHLIHFDVKNDVLAH